MLQPRGTQTDREKPGHQERKRKRTCSPRKTESMASRQTSANIPRAAKKSRPENPSQSREDRLTYKIKWLKGTRVKKCYGCRGSIRDPPHVPPPPNDMVFTCNEHRLYPTTEGALRFSMKKEATHCHLSITCIQQKARSSILKMLKYQRKIVNDFLQATKSALKSSWVLTCSLIKELLKDLVRKRYCFQLLGRLINHRIILA